jgi:hypothetical protein
LIHAAFHFKKGIEAFYACSRKATINFVISVRLSVRMEKIGCHWTDFEEI